MQDIDVHINSTDNLEHIFLGLHLSSANTPARDDLERRHN